MQRIFILPLIVCLMFSLVIPSFAEAPNKDKTISVIIGGFSASGSTKKGLYGIPDNQSLIDKASELMKLPNGYYEPTAPNQIVQVQYYGDTAPNYYSQKDIEEIAAVGKGTPRYALISAKFIKHLLTTTGATHVNLGGGSYGGLIGRYLIERDVEGLASSGKFIRWLTLEGAVCGAYPANLSTDKELQKLLVEYLGLDISDPLTMNHPWVSKNIHNPPTASACPYFKNILIGNHVSADDDPENGSLVTVLVNRPNDGLLLVDDMFLKDIKKEYRFRGKMPARVNTNTTHMSAKKDPTFLANIINFMQGTKRVTVRVAQGKASKFDEEEYLFGPAEIVFQGEIYSPYAASKWNIDKPVAVINRTHHTASVVKFGKNEREGKSVGTVLYDWMIHPNEKTLKLKLWAEEVDWDDVYKIEEDFLNPYENLGGADLEIAVDEVGRKVYKVKADKWEVSLLVEVYDYGFNK